MINNLQSRLRQEVSYKHPFEDVSSLKTQNMGIKTKGRWNPKIHLFLSCHIYILTVTVDALTSNTPTYSLQIPLSTKNFTPPLLLSSSHHQLEFKSWDLGWRNNTDLLCYISEMPVTMPQKHSLQGELWLCQNQGRGTSCLLLLFLKVPCVIAL